MDFSAGGRAGPEVTAGPGGVSRTSPGLPETPDLPAIERALLEHWRIERGGHGGADTAGTSPRDCFCDPLPASELPGLHHAPALALADLLTRFRSMAGTGGAGLAGGSVRTAWSCHGLSIEVAVERQLGITGRAGLETYGAERFAERCREFAGRHVAAFAAFGERLGCGPWLERVPRTMDPDQVETVWASIKAAFDRGSLVRRTTVRPYCPRCETILSRSDLTGAGALREADDPVIIVRFRLTGLPPGASVGGSDLGEHGRELPATDLLVATNEPWTLPANSAVAADPAATYVIARRSGYPDRVILADRHFARLLGDGWYMTGRISGAELIGATYQPPFRPAGSADDRHVISGAFVNAAAGTGLMHLAPAFGEAGLAAAEALRLPVANPIRADGRFGDQLPLVSGEFFKDTGPALINDLADRGLLFSASQRRRKSAHCAHCGSPLLRSARPAWFLRTAATTEGQAGGSGGADDPESQAGGPESGDSDLADWALSRTRFWGTPLPVWECEQAHLTCAGSLAELSGLAGADLSGLDPHRPWADDVVITCPRCGSPGHRVPEVIDARYDAAVAAVTAANFAGLGPPAAGDQFQAGTGILITSGQDPDWPEALALVQRASAAPVRMAAVRTGPARDHENKVVHSGRGNTVAAGPLLEAHGADATRWHCLAASGPDSSRRLSPGDLTDVTTRVLLRYWQAAAHLTRAASTAGLPLAELPRRVEAPPRQSRPPLDRWLISELNVTIAEVTASLEASDPAGAQRQLERFIAGLSGWYLRRSRQRMRMPPSTPTGAAALSTLYEALEALTRLMAPFTPFITSRVWRSIRPAGAPDSVRLCPWPVPDSDAVDEELASQMALIRRLARLGRRARTSAGIDTRQELDRAWVSAEGFPALPPALKAELLGELNVAGLKAARAPKLTEDQPGLAIGRRGEAVWLDPGLTPAMRLTELAGQEPISA